MRQHTCTPDPTGETSTVNDAPDSTPSPWRFIAAARCPACGAEDRIRLRIEAGGQRRNCVACGHDELLLAQTPAADVPGGRLDPDASPAADDPGAPRAVRLVDPSRD